VPANPGRTIAALTGWLILGALVSPAAAQQQLADPNYRPVVERPAYPGGGPVVAIDEAHDNLHTLGGQYRPFAELLIADGYQVDPWTGTFSKAAYSWHFVFPRYKNDQSAGRIYLW
jgi:hypothetical protein